MKHYNECAERIVDLMNGHVNAAAELQSRTLKSYSNDPMNFVNNFINTMEWGAEVKDVYRAREHARVLNHIKGAMDEGDSIGVAVEKMLTVFRNHYAEELLRGHCNRSTNPYSNACADDKREVIARMHESFCGRLTALQAAKQRDEADKKDEDNGITRVKWRTATEEDRSLLIHDMKAARCISKLSRDYQLLLKGKSNGLNPEIVRQYGTLISFGDYRLENR